MICVYLQNTSTTLLAILTVVICSASAADLGWDRSVETIPPSYYNLSTANVLRCGKLCERQGKCAAVTFDARERHCYMHDTPLNANEATKGLGGRFLVKNYPDQSKPDASENTCDRDTQISVPTVHHKHGRCHDIIEKNVCEPSPCQNNATCEDKKNDYYCKCQLRYTGKNCTVDKCPAVRGYFLRVYDHMLLCLKYHPSKMNNTVAKSTCKNDGGHLVLIESLVVRTRIKDILTELNVTDPVWLDGFDESTKNLFLSWKGKPLAWIEWGSNNPGDSGSEDCLFGKPSDDYKHRDEHCQYAHTVLCQIDIM